LPLASADRRKFMSRKIAWKSREIGPPSIQHLNST
jgi:hypothetical protein